MNTAPTAAALAFSAQAAHFDKAEEANAILKSWRQRIYDQVDQHLSPGSDILELNAGTGIDALRFANLGHHVLATELAAGMMDVLRAKTAGVANVTCKQLSFDHLHSLEGSYDLIFSNFGGLNCTENLSLVTSQFKRLVKPGGRVTLVIMPPMAPWEWLRLLRGNTSQAFRRLQKQGSRANVEGHMFTTWYYSLYDLRQLMTKDFVLEKATGLGSISPPPASLKVHAQWPSLTKFLERVDKILSRFPPFNRWADHLIVTFRKL